MATRPVLQRPGLQTWVESETHPSLGTGNPYSQDMRTLVMFISQHVNENDPRVSHLIGLLRQAHVYPSAMTQRRWEQLSTDLGHVRPCRLTGNLSSPERTVHCSLCFR